MPTALHALVGKRLSKARAMYLMESGELLPQRCQVVWNVGGNPLTQPIAELQVPQALELRPVRRIGTYEAAPNSIAMYPVRRDGRALLLSLESQLELHHVAQLDREPGVSDLVAQPFMMLWRHSEGTLVHVPDLAMSVDGRLAVADVKPTVAQARPWVAAVFALCGRTLRLANVDFHVLGDLTPQRSHNLMLIMGYRERNPFLDEPLRAVVAARPATIGGAFMILATNSEDGSTDRQAALGIPLSAQRTGQAVIRHLLAVGACDTDLDEPLCLASPLRWRTPDPQESQGAS